MTIMIDGSYPDSFKVRGHDLISSVSLFTTYGRAAGDIGKLPGQTERAAIIHLTKSPGLTYSPEKDKYVSDSDDEKRNQFEEAKKKLGDIELAPGLSPLKGRIELKNREQMPDALRALGLPEDQIATITARMNLPCEVIEQMHMQNKNRPRGKS